MLTEAELDAIAERVAQKLAERAQPVYLQPIFQPAPAWPSPTYRYPFYMGGAV